MTLGFVMPFAEAIDCHATPQRAPMALKESPGRTV
jgi:hypothetical protein